MYADDSIMCCLFPTECNMYPQTPEVIFWQIVEYLNMMMVIISPIIIVWSIVKIALKLLKNKKTKLVEDCKDFEEKPLEELIKEVDADCLDDHSSSENNSNGDGDRTCSDSDLSVPPTDTVRKYKESSILDQSNSDCFKTYLSLSEIIKDANIRNSSNSAKQCFSSSSEEIEQYNYIVDDNDEFISKDQSLTRVPKKEIMRVMQETENSEQLKDTCFSSSSEEIEQYNYIVDDNDEFISKDQSLTRVPKKEIMRVMQETENSEQLKDTNKKTKLVEDCKDFEEKPLEELIKEVDADCLDDHSSSENNSNGDGDRTCSDSDLSVPPTDTVRKYKESSILDQSNSDCFKTYLSLSEIIKDANIRNSSNSAKQCFSSSSEEIEQYNYIVDDNDEFISKDQSLTRVPKKEIMRVMQETENSEQLKDTCFSSSSEEIEQYNYIVDDNDEFISKDQSLTRVPKKEIMRVMQETENSEQLKDTLPVTHSVQSTTKSVRNQNKLINDRS